MNRAIWDDYRPGVINDKIKYWVYLWEHMILNFPQLLFGLELTNPQVILRDIIYEIEDNKLRNEENNKYFLKKLKCLSGKDYVIRNKFKTEFTLIEEMLGEQKKKKRIFISQLCEDTLDLMVQENYFLEAYNRLKSLLISTNYGDKVYEEIRIISQNLIIDLLIKGYTLKTIQGLPETLFYRYSEFDDGKITTKYPHKTNSKNFYDDNKFNFEEFNDALKKELDSLELLANIGEVYSFQFIDPVSKNVFEKLYFESPQCFNIGYNLSIEQRLMQFLKYYEREGFKYIFIVQIKGLKGDVNFNIGDVNFYSPTIAPYSKSRKTREKEFFEFYQVSFKLTEKNLESLINKIDAEKLNPLLDKEFSKEELVRKLRELKFKEEEIEPISHRAFYPKALYLNAAVEIELLDPNEPGIKAFNTIEKALDFLKLYHKDDGILKINENNFLIVDVNGEEKGFRKTYNEELHEWYNSLVPNQEYLETSLKKIKDTICEFLYLPSKDLSSVQEKICQALYWYRKAKEYNRDEDILLNYWIALEQFTKLEAEFTESFTQKNSSIEIIIELLIPVVISDYIYAMAWEVYFALNLEIKNQESFITLPDNLIEKLGFNSTTKMLKDFLKNIDELINEIELKSFKERLEFIRKFYYNNNFAVKEINKEIDKIKDDIRLIYRCRNRIVHNAHFDKTTLFYPLRIVENFIGLLTRRVIYRYVEQPEQTLEDIYTIEYIEHKKLLKKLKTSNLIDILKL